MNFDALRQKIIDKAIRGELVPQLESEPTVETITEKLGEVPFDIPAKWKWCILETAAVINPKIGACNDNLTITFVPMKCVAEGYNNSILHPEVKHWKDVKNGFSKFQDNDVLLAKITPCFQNRKSAIAYNLINNTGAGSTEFHILRARASIVTPGYLLLFFKSEYFISYGIKKFKGVVGQQRISTNDLKSTPLPLPPLNEQSRIVEQAKKLLTIIDKVATKCGEMYDFLLPRFKNILLEKALHGSLVPQLGTEPAVKTFESSPKTPPYTIPEKWKWTYLGNVITLVSGRDLTKNNILINNEGIPYITGASQIKDGQIVVNRWTNSPCVISEKGDLLLTCKGTVGKMALNTIGSIHIARQIMAIRPSQYVTNGFLHCFLQYLSPVFKANSKSMIPGIDRKTVLEQPVPIPPLEEQQRIVKRVRELVSELGFLDCN